VSGWVWRLLALGLGLIVLAGCGGPDERLVELDARIKALDGQMKLGEVREVPLPVLHKGEWLVAMNGRYAGSICDPSPFPEKLSSKLTLEYGGSELVATYLLLVNVDSINSKFPLSSLSEYGSVRGVGDDRWTCALIADPTHRALVVECMKPVSDKAAGRACEVVLRAVK
jgi:hypothetical protein